MNVRSATGLLLGRRPPVYSPVSLKGLLGVGGGAVDLERRVTDLLRRDYDADNVRLYGSGTQALQAAIELAVAVVGGKTCVALPALSCFEVASAAVGAGRPILLYDLEPRTLGPELVSLERALTAGARVVVVAPLYGVPVAWDELERLVAHHDALVVEDAAQGHGASWGGRKLGSLGALSVLSFGRGKGWTAGSGGALLVRDGAQLGDGALQRLRSRDRPRRTRELAVGVAAAMQWAFSRPALYGLPASISWLGLGETRYRDPRPQGLMTSVGMRILLAAAESAEREAVARRSNAEELLARLPDCDGVHAIEPPPGSRPGYLRLPVRLSAGMKGFTSRAEAQRWGIAPTYPSALGALRAVRERLAGTPHTPGALQLVQQLVTLPVHSQTTAADREEVLRLLNTYGRKVGPRRPQAVSGAGMPVAGFIL